MGLIPSSYGSFADLLARAKTQAQLRGTDITSGNVKGMASGYFSDALDASNQDRAYNLAESSQNLAEKAQATSESQFAQSLAQQKEQMAAQQDAAAKAAKMGNIQTGISTGLGAASLIGKEALISGAKSLASGVGSLFGGGAESTLPAAYSATYGIGGTGAGSAAPIIAENVSLAPAAAQLTGTATGAGAASGGSSIGGSFGAGGVGALIAGGMLTKKAMQSTIPRQDEKIGGVLYQPQGYAANAAQHPVAAVLTPGQALMDAGILDKDTAVGQFLNIPTKIEEEAMGWLGDRLGCIIVTACTSPDSEEVNITREYRDRFLNHAELRGYYMIAEKVVPLIQRSKVLKWFVKKCLVDRLIDYGEVALGRKEKTALWSSSAVSKGFLNLCRTVGQSRERYVRCNGEVF